MKWWIHPTGCSHRHCQRQSRPRRLKQIDYLWFSYFWCEQAFSYPKHVLVICLILCSVLRKSFFSDYKKEEDPTLYCSEKTGRGPLTGSWTVCTQKTLKAIQLIWTGEHLFIFPLHKICQIPIFSFQKTVEPVMTAYKLVTVQFKWWDERKTKCQSVGKKAWTTDHDKWWWYVGNDCYYLFVF